MKWQVHVSLLKNQQIDKSCYTEKKKSRYELIISGKRKYKTHTEDSTVLKYNIEILWTILCPQIYQLGWKGQIP